jgi:hypothetical protein
MEKSEACGLVKRKRFRLAFGRCKDRILATKLAILEVSSSSSIPPRISRNDTSIGPAPLSSKNFPRHNSSNVRIIRFSLTQWDGRKFSHKNNTEEHQRLISRYSIKHCCYCCWKNYIKYRESVVIAWFGPTLEKETSLIHGTRFINDLTDRKERTKWILNFLLCYLTTLSITDIT